MSRVLDLNEKYKSIVLSSFISEPKSSLHVKFHIIPYLIMLMYSDRRGQRISKGGSEILKVVVSNATRPGG